jgi:hypothetical protein
VSFSSSCSSPLTVSLDVQLDIICANGSGEAVTKFVETRFNGKVMQSFSGHIKFALPLEVGRGLGALFETMEAEKSALKISTYCISSITLEQVFVRFAKLQED